MHVAADALHVALAGGGTVAIRADGADVEPDLTAFRLRAEAGDDAGERAGDLAEPGGFAAGGNDVVVFRSETWLEAPAASDDGTGPSDTLLQLTGSPLQRSPDAIATCTVDDAVVVAATDGTGLLVRCGLRPHTIDVVVDRVAIARFLAERHYAADPSGG